MWLRFIAISLLAVNCSCWSFKDADTFELNLDAEVHKVEKYDEVPYVSRSEFRWEHVQYGRCFGCGNESYIKDTMVCVQRMNVTIKIYATERNMIGVYKVPNAKCDGVQKPPQIQPKGCGPPCSTVRLLRKEGIGCHCNDSAKVAYQAPSLVCQDNTGRVVDLALCQTLYIKRRERYAAVECDYAKLCSSKAEWVSGEWEKCSESNPVKQTRPVTCGIQLHGSFVAMHPASCESERPATIRYCARWGVGSWFCNKATAMATRPVICYRYEGRIRRLDHSLCSWHSMPDKENPCHLVGG